MRTILHKWSACGPKSALRTSTAAVEVAAEWLVDMEQEDTVGAPADGALGLLYAGAVERATTVIGCDVNKSVKSSLHSEKVKI